MVGRVSVAPVPTVHAAVRHVVGSDVVGKVVLLLGSHHRGFLARAEVGCCRGEGVDGGRIMKKNRCILLKILLM